MLEIRNLVKTYGNGPRAVDGLTLSVDAGDIYGFIGHNGAGKTTTLKCISGILPFDEGRSSSTGSISERIRWRQSASCATSRTIRTSTRS